MNGDDDMSQDSFIDIDAYSPGQMKVLLPFKFSIANARPTNNEHQGRNPC
jgi:hypothetical protein